MSAARGKIHLARAYIDTDAAHKLIPAAEHQYDYENHENQRRSGDRDDEFSLRT